VTRWLPEIVAAVCLAALIALTIAANANAHFTSGCRKNPCKRHVVRPYQPKLRAIATCESGRRWHLNTGNGFYGGVQFHPQTWRATGSRYAYAHHAPRLEQKYRTVVWASRIGWAWGSTAGWPVCGR
jgi:hypothetical protein